MSGKSKRRNWSAKEKLRIVLAGLDGTIEISELCRREGINPTQYYGWKKQLLNSASQVFADQRKKPSAQDERLESDLRRAKDVIAEITAENLELKKNVLGLEDHGHLPPELQRQVHETVEATKSRSGWSVKRTLGVLGIGVSSYYRWLKEARSAQELPKKPEKPVQVYEATEDEKSAVRAYALKHPAIRHRELAWRMVDEDVVCLSPSTVYRILKAQDLVSPWRRREKRSRDDHEKATRPDERWATDLMYVEVAGRKYYQLNFIDEYSRYIVHHELLANMEGGTVSVEAQRAIETLLKEKGGEIPQLGMPEMRSDNGSCYISREFRGVLDEHGLCHNRIKPHCPEENGIMERANRTFREAMDGEELMDLYQAREVMTKIIDWYNHERLHRALGYLKPIDYYRGNPGQLHEARRHKLAQARHHRREQNLKLRQRTLPLESGESVA